MIEAYDLHTYGHFDLHPLSLLPTDQFQFGQYEKSALLTLDLLEGVGRHVGSVENVEGPGEDLEPEDEGRGEDEREGDREPADDPDGQVVRAQELKPAGLRPGGQGHQSQGSGHEEGHGDGFHEERHDRGDEQSRRKAEDVVGRHEAPDLAEQERRARRVAHNDEVLID